MKTDDDKFSAVWLSHSSISDFLTCPKLYYYVHIYKNPRSGRKITIMNPNLALGQAVHAVIEELSLLPSDQRLEKPLLHRFDIAWKSVADKKGGFTSSPQEKEFKDRGIAMLERLEKNPGPLLHKALKIKQDLPHYWFSEEENLILCGKVDWLEYLEDQDAVHVIDFKAGRRKEKEDSLQLPIYLLLLKNTQSRKVVRMSYWYLHSSDEPTEVPLPGEEDAKERIMKIGKRIKLARQLNHFACSKDEKNGCIACGQYEAVIKGKGEFVGVGEYNKEVYILPEKSVAL